MLIGDYKLWQKCEKVKLKAIRRAFAKDEKLAGEGKPGEPGGKANESTKCESKSTRKQNQLCPFSWNNQKGQAKRSLKYG